MMKPGMHIIRFGIAALLAATATACTPEQRPASETRPDSDGRLVEISLPARETMEADVASLIEEQWNELQEARSVDDATPESTAEAYAQFGLACFGNGLVSTAESAFVNATRLAPQDARWTYFLALIREFTGMLDDAAAGFESVLALRPEDLPALLHLGDVRLEQARFADARKAYSRALELNVDSAAAHYGLGRVASETGDDELAVRHYEQALDLQPDASRVNYMLGLAWRNLGDMELAQSYLAKRGDAEPSFDDPLFDEISGGRARVGGLWANMNAGSQAFIDGNYPLAVQEYRIATGNHPDDPRSWQSLGMALNRIGDSAGAVEAYRKSLELADDSAVVHHDLAEILIRDRQLSDAEQHLLKAIEFDPQRIDTYEIYAQLLIANGRLDEALVAYDRAIALDPQSSSLAISRTEVLIAMGRTDEALERLAASVGDNPRDQTLRLAYGMMLSGAGRTDEAEAEIRRTLMVATDDGTRARARFALGQVFLSSGAGPQAISEFEEALSLNPDHRAARLALARTHVRSRNVEQALSTYEALRARAPHDDAARIEAATAAIFVQRGAYARRLLEAGATETASARLLSALARLLALSPDPEVRDTERALQYAQRSFEMSGAPRHAETVALCLAANGRFEEAVEIQQELVREVPQRDSAGRERMEENLRRYKARSLGRLPLDSA